MAAVSSGKIRRKRTSSFLSRGPRGSRYLNTQQIDVQVSPCMDVGFEAAVLFYTVAGHAAVPMCDNSPTLSRYLGLDSVGCFSPLS